TDAPCGWERSRCAPLRVGLLQEACPAEPGGLGGWRSLPPATQATGAARSRTALIGKKLRRALPGEDARRVRKKGLRRMLGNLLEKSGRFRAPAVSLVSLGRTKHRLEDSTNVAAGKPNVEIDANPFRAHRPSHHGALTNDRQKVIECGGIVARLKDFALQ